MYCYIYDEDLYERVNSYIIEHKDNIFELLHSCWFYQIISKRPLKIYSNKVKKN
jgi:hypothetical protein